MLRFLSTLYQPIKMTAATSARKSFVIETKAIKKASAIYRVIKHSLRLQIIEIIDKARAINFTPIYTRVRT